MTSGTQEKQREIARVNRIKAMSDPLRAKILLLLVDGPNSPSKLAIALKADPQKVNYQTKRLVDLGCAELVDEIPRRGAIEHVYRATERHLVETEEWEELAPELKEHLAGEFAQAIIDDLVLGTRARAIGIDKHFHLTRTPILVDEQGREEILEIYERARLEVLEAQDRSASRMAEADNESKGINMSSCLAAFPVPPSPSHGSTE